MRKRLPIKRVRRKKRQENDFDAWDEENWAEWMVCGDTNATPQAA